MSLPKIKEVDNLSITELQKEILLVRTQLFKLRFKKGTRQDFKPHLFKHKRHRLRQLLMVAAQQLSKNSEKT